MTVRAKFTCVSVELFHPAPIESMRYTSATEQKTVTTWPRKFRFMPQYDASVPEDQRYAQATPSGELWLNVDNPAVSFEPGQAYYFDITPVPAAATGQDQR